MKPTPQRRSLRLALHSAAARYTRPRSPPPPPDPPRPRLAAVTAPTLLITGGHDETVLGLNRRPRPNRAAGTSWQ